MLDRAVGGLNSVSTTNSLFMYGLSCHIRSGVVGGGGWIALIGQRLVGLLGGFLRGEGNSAMLGSPCGAVAQLGERRVRNAKVGSSILLRSTKSSSKEPRRMMRLFAFVRWFRVV